MAVYDFDPGSGRITEKQVISTLPAGWAGTSHTADIHVSPDGRFVYRVQQRTRFDRDIFGRSGYRSAGSGGLRTDARSNAEELCAFAGRKIFFWPKIRTPRP